MTTHNTKHIFGIALLLALALSGPACAEEAIDITNLAFRTGPYAETGAALANGQRDYFQMLNERDGGVNGIRLSYSECETGFNTDKGVECYDKAKAASIVTQPWSPATTLAILPKAAADKRPLLAAGHGISAMADGTVFGWGFNPPISYWDGASILLKDIADGDLDKLRGKKVALLHLDAPYGEEPIALLKEYADTFGFSLVAVPVGAKEMQSQSPQWRQIKEQGADFVLLWGWGTMNAGALAEAAKVGFPMDRIAGIWWSGNDEDLKAAGDAAKGYRIVSWNMPSREAEAMRDIERYVLKSGKSQVAPEELGGLLYQRGVLASMFVAEVIKAAQLHFDVRLINGEQMRWGLENLSIDEAALASLGMEGMIAPFATSCRDHSGRGGAWMLQWDGARLVKTSDILKADQEMIAPLVEAEAKKFAEAHAPWAMNEGCAAGQSAPTAP
ncbi:ABC transporter substrate-binding protein [Aminobacter sp. HY435]|uniref:ABC transporter substrate-binding protein n=1 Tax=Aminobacter sp. HY435 TaxID=2970917 RepID=UPI0022B98529|nr:ABC transporter substrate-binding protein [Aminobacter sp. HY435]